MWIINNQVWRLYSGYAAADTSVSFVSQQQGEQTVVWSDWSIKSNITNKKY